MIFPIEDIINLFLLCGESWCAQKIFRAFAEPKLNFRAAKYAPGIFWLACTLFCYYFFTNGVYELTLLIKLVTCALGLMLFSVFWYRGGILQRIFPAVLFVAVRELTMHSTTSLMLFNTLALNAVTELALRQAISYDDFVFLLKLISETIIFLIEAIRIVIINFALNRIIKSYHYKLRLEKETAAYLLPSVVGIMMCAILRLILLSIENGMAILIYERCPWLYAIIPAASVSLLAMIIYSFRLNQDVAGLRREQADRAVLESQLASIQDTYEERERAYESVRAARHDMNNNLAALKGLINRKCPGDEEIGRFFESMSIPPDQPCGTVNTGNIVCDTVVGGKLRLAETEIPDIALDAEDFVFIEGVKPFDLGVILSNGLDNAVEACRRFKEKFPEERPFITLRSFRKKNMAFVEIENSFDGVIRIDGETGLPETAKENRELHGIGMRNIKNCAEKYSGGIDFIAGDRRFVLSVMMKI